MKKLKSSAKELSSSEDKSDEWKKLFKELDDLLLGGITDQINNLCSYFRNEIVKHLSINDDNNDLIRDFGDESTFDISTMSVNQIREKFGDKSSIDLPEQMQQLLVEYTLLPVCRIPVDPKPSSKFSLSFINEVLFKQFQLNTVFSENVNHLFSTIIIPLLTDGDFTNEEYQKKLGKKIDELKSEKKKQFIEFLNSYFASLVFFCQFELLKQLSEWLFLFSNSIKLWIIKSFFTKFLTTSQSKCQPLRELAQKVLSKHQSLIIKEEGHYVKHNVNNHFLTDQITEEDAESLVKPPTTKAQVASQLVLKLLDMSLNEYSQEERKKSECLRHCIEILKYGNLHSIMDDSSTSDEKSKSIPISKSLRGYSILISSEYGQEMMEKLWPMLYGFIENYTSELEKPTRISHQIGLQLLSLFDLVYPSIEKSQVANYFYLNDCFLPLTMKLLKVLNSRFETDSSQSVTMEIKLANRALRVFVKHSTKTSNNLDAVQFFQVIQEPSHCSKLKIKKFITDISDGLVFESLLHPSKYLLRDSMSSQKTEELYKSLEKTLLVWSNFFLYLYNACCLERTPERKILDPFEDEDQQEQQNEVSEATRKYRHVDKLNIIFTQLVECACMFDYNHFVHKSLSDSPIGKFAHLAKKAESLNELVRAILVVILQKPFIVDGILSRENLNVISERLGITSE
ncbi:predicted protein [Naegleria gruberi]|uniref:Predicted protein n=1 Tax=Naegleria gruberi TaxID=5762 RepID=D2UZB3_NAEGR|nr:uncharacterized protein NAEGRDRAFT_61876 [Naegleria gruberi]EFC49917.1 predicted protein [Naegleria gruberi]|eukprot:XP_002682661.1 predicted protein [Naegleria gruberi strain NEG-M]